MPTFKTHSSIGITFYFKTSQYCFGILQKGKTNPSRTLRLRASDNLTSLLQFHDADKSKKYIFMQECSWASCIFLFDTFLQSELRLCSCRSEVKKPPPIYILCPTATFSLGPPEFLFISVLSPLSRFNTKRSDKNLTSHRNMNTKSTEIIIETKEFNIL